MVEAINLVNNFKVEKVIFNFGDYNDLEKDLINELAKKFNYDYYYKPKDLIEFFDLRVKMQLYKPDYEQYIDCSYISICSFFPELKLQIYYCMKTVLIKKRKRKVLRKDKLEYLLAIFYLC